MHTGVRRRGCARANADTHHLGYNTLGHAEFNKVKLAMPQLTSRCMRRDRVKSIQSQRYVHCWSHGNQSTCSNRDPVSTGIVSCRGPLAAVDVRRWLSSYGNARPTWRQYGQLPVGPLCVVRRLAGGPCSVAPHTVADLSTHARSAQTLYT